MKLADDLVEAFSALGRLAAHALKAFLGVLMGACLLVVVAAGGIFVLHWAAWFLQEFYR